ncbi:carbohydrate ABC transporter membrane protein 1, CUT1 family [Actinacidiphila yanglinensis]|uniref:Carbohydrate ABC transporter membrane protein 1, CUT1 family n=1 Tax=Actinacidiphila yanglinensis TaxID=310779 RepID=A0A1H6CX59_9ACTN|nr:sugar ABC transporter permease [Actinacidiphila yanglinensis]SEG77313.1 carbohydrate ABC transporter membrane protein 1, CUT1 family [Actinacidiphila yanglinensis]
MAPTTARPRRTSRFPYLLVLPAVLLLAAFVVAPGCYALVLSLQRSKVNGGLLGGGTHTVFAGLANYRDVLGDTQLRSGVVRMLALGAVTVPGTVLLALLFAVLLDLEHTRLRRVTRLAIFLPYAVPGVIASLMWGFLYLPATSPIGGDRVDFFGQVAVYFSVSNVVVWGAVGFNMIVIYTALRALPPELTESARLDGATERQIVLRIKVPLVMPAVVMCTLFSVLAALQVFNEPNTLKPLSNAVSSTWVPLMQIYDQAFGNSDIHSAAATSVVLAAAALVLSFLTARIIQSRVQREAE